MPSRRPELDDCWPVLVTYTTTHLVWVEASDQAAAVSYMETEPYERTNAQNVVDGDWETRAPESWEHPLHGNADAHIETTRRRRWTFDWEHVKAMTEAENRTAVPLADRLTCLACETWREPGHEQSRAHEGKLRTLEWEAFRQAAGIPELVVA